MAYTDPNLHVFVTGEIMTAANLKTYVGDNIVALRNGMVARAGRTISYAIPSGVTTTIPFDFETYDNAAIHDTGVNPERFRMLVAGIWHLGSCIDYDGESGTATGVRTLEAWRNGTDVLSAVIHHASGSGAHEEEISTDYVFASSDYVVFRTFHDAGHDLGLLGINGGLGPGATGHCHFVGAGL